MGNTPSAVPNGAQVNAVHLSLTCHGNGTTMVDTTLSINTPLAASSYYISGISGVVQVGEFFTSGRVDLGFRVGDQNTEFSAYNYDSDRLGLPGLTSGGGTNIGVVGIREYPIINGGDGRIALTSLNYTLVVAEFQSVSYVCDIPENILAVIGNDGSTQPYVLQAQGSLPTPAIGNKVTEANIPFSCINPRMEQFNVSMRGTTALTVSGNFSVDGFLLFVRLPPAEIQAFEAAGGNMADVGFLLSKDEISGAQYGLGFNVSSATPGLFDLVNNFVPSNPKDTQPGPVKNDYKIMNDMDTIPFPIDGSLSIGQFDATQGVFSMQPLGMNGILADRGLNLVELLQCTVNVPIELFAAIVV